jgi:hypothetical protein
MSILTRFHVSAVLALTLGLASTAGAQHLIEVRGADTKYRYADWNYTFPSGFVADVFDVTRAIGKRWEVGVQSGFFRAGDAWNPQVGPLVKFNVGRGAWAASCRFGPQREFRVGRVVTFWNAGSAHMRAVVAAALVSFASLVAIAQPAREPAPAANEAVAFPVAIRVDAEHSNAFTRWQRMGAPTAPSDAQYAELVAAGQLATIGEPADVIVEGGTARIAPTLPRRAVSPLVLEW